MAEDGAASNVSVVENGRITLACPAEGTPTPRVSWYFKDQGPLTDATSDGRVSVLPDGALQIERARVSDAGPYTCLAQNVAGNASKHFDVHVLCGFSIMIIFINQYQREGDGSVAKWLACWTQAQKARVQIAVETLSGNSFMQTVHTHRASVHRSAKFVADLLRVARVTSGLTESNRSLPPGL